MFKKILILVIVLAIGLVGGFYAFRTFFNKEKPMGEFQWGITMRPAALGKYHSSVWMQQIKLAKEMGVKYVRLGWDYNGKEKAMAINDEIIKYLENNGLQTMLVIEQDPATITKDNYQEGYKNGYDIASHFKGRIKFYQMANEGSAQVIKGPTLNGQEKEHYNEEEYQKLLTYLKGLSDGIYKADPKAQTVVSMVFTHTVYLDKLAADSLKYDVIGVDWYDWMGPFQEKKLENGQLLADKLKSFGKPITFAEINHLAAPDSKNPKTRTKVDETKQANFITSTAKWAWENRDFVQGFYVLELVDNVNTPYPEYFGLITAAKTPSGTYVPGEVRKAYNAYRDLIKQYSK